MATKLPEMLAFEGKIVCSEGLMYSCTFAGREDSGHAERIRLQTKAVRGTKSNKAKPADYDKLHEPNLQVVDAAMLHIEHDTLRLRFTVKFLGGVGIPIACNNPDFRSRVEEQARNYIERQTLAELARRYALNIANGRFLFRNRQGAAQVEVVVGLGGSGEEEAAQRLRFDALSLPIRDFEPHTHGEELAALTAYIQGGLEGRTDYALLEVEAYARIGLGQTVYPSQELVLERGGGKDRKSKVLYAVYDQAAVHSQKIGNALRTIDTFYSEYDQYGPIPVEPYGAVTTLSRVFRSPRDKHDFYTLLSKFAAGEQLSDGDQHYVMAVLIRGGVFGEKE